MALQPITILQQALERIVAARDFNAEHGLYPPEVMTAMRENEQQFDDWAADLASEALQQAGLSS